MKTKIGLTTKNISEFEDYLQSDFTEITRGGIIYNKLFAFEVHINDRFEITFDNEEEFQTWLTDFVYFIVPSDYIPVISRYKNVVREAYPKLAFNIVCEKYKINIAGEDIEIPSSIVNVIPGSANMFDEAGINIIDTIINNWNSMNPNKQILPPYRFNSYKELIEYREKCINGV